MTTVFVQRSGGKITALYANRQPGYAEEELAEDHPEVVAVRNPPPTVDDYKAAITAHLDAWARTRDYENIHTAVSYAEDPNPVYAAEGLAARNARSAVWTYATGEFDKVTGGLRPQPTVADLIGELPELTWPV